MITIQVKVKPSSFKDEISIDENHQFVIKIREKPIDGAANEYLVKWLASALRIRKSAVNIKKGLTSQFKTIELECKEEDLKKLLNNQ